MGTSETSDENLTESTPEAADVPENETSVLENAQGCVTCSDIILNLDAVQEQSRCTRLQPPSRYDKAAEIISVAKNTATT